MNTIPYLAAHQAAHAELTRRTPQDRFYAGPRLLYLRCAPKGHQLGAVYPTS